MDNIKGIPLARTLLLIGLAMGGCALFQQHMPGLTMSDADLVSVLESIDQGEIDAAQLAMEKASAPEVRAFAGRILYEHRAMVEANGQLATHLSLQPEPPALASQLKQAHDKAMQRLRARSGSNFDRAYVEHEIRQHVQAFNFLETAAESESNLTLKQDLIRTGPDLLSHISAARALERHLGSDQRDTVALR
jgi:putative membrane protein